MSILLPLRLLPLPMRDKLLLIQDPRGQLSPFNMLLPMRDQPIQWIILGHRAPDLDIDVLGSVTWPGTKGSGSNAIGV